MEFVNIGKKKVLVKFGIVALTTAMDKYGFTTVNETHELISKLEVSYLPDFLYLGIENAATVMKKPVPVTLEEVQTAFNADLRLVTQTMEIFALDLAGPQEDDEETEAEKKQEPPKFKK